MALTPARASQSTVQWKPLTVIQVTKPIEKKRRPSTAKG
jgi:hypothetical protein